MTKILWTKSGNGCCEGHLNDELCPTCGHLTLSRVWVDGHRDWNGYSYDGGFEWHCRYCSLLAKEKKVLTEPKTKNQKETYKYLIEEHKHRYNKLIRKKGELESELDILKRNIKEIDDELKT